MPVRKYRSVEEMPGARPLRPLDPDNLRIACELTVSGSNRPLPIGLQIFNVFDADAQPQQRRRQMLLIRVRRASLQGRHYPSQTGRVPNQLDDRVVALETADHFLDRFASRLRKASLEYDGVDTSCEEEVS